MGQQTQIVREDLTGTAVGRYVVVRRLGTGGMGEVYLAEDSKLKRTVALKRMSSRLRADERYRQRFLKEAERASRLMHPQIATLYDILEIDGEMFLVIEYVNGQTLRKAIRDPLDFETFLRVAVQCADALDAAHASGVVHRDIKPENIMLTQSGSIKILDFGLAKEIPIGSAAESGENIATTGALSGTPAYMAPEVLMELRPDGRADIFSLGVVLYEILTGQHPFLANSFVETTDRIIRKSPPAIRELNPKIPSEIEQAVMRMLAKAPEERYESAAQLAADLRRIQRELSYEPSPVQPGQIIKAPGVLPASSRSLWRSLPVAILLMVMLIAVGMLTVRLHQLTSGKKLSEIPEKRHLAVLPFSTVGNDAPSTAFSDGLSETLTAKLTQLTDKYPIDVVPMSELRYERVSSAEQAQKTFNVNLVLEGQLQTYGKQVRINYSLVDPLTRRQLRASTITADYTDPFTVEDRVVDSVLSTLDLELQGQEREAMRIRGTSDPEAYEFYLRGLGYLQDYEKTENLDSAITVFNHALEKDKKFALAFAGLGRAFLLKYRQTHDSLWIDKARLACETSLGLVENQPDAHSCMGSLYVYTGKYEQAIAQYRRAIAIDPADGNYYRSMATAYQQMNNFPEAEKIFLNALKLPNYLSNYNWLAYFYVSQGRYEDAANIYQKMTALAPDNFIAYQNLGAMYINLGQYSEAVPALEKSVSIRPTGGAYSNLATAHFYRKDYASASQGYRQAIALDPGNYLLWRNLGDAYYWQSMTHSEASAAYSKSVELCEQALKVNPKDANALRVLASAEAMLNQKNQALRDLQKALEVAPTDPMLLYNAALIYAQFKDTNSVLHWLERALKAGTTAAQTQAAPWFDYLANDKRFQQLLKTATRQKNNS